MSIIALVATGRTSGFSPTDLFWDFYLNGAPQSSTLSLQQRNWVGVTEQSDGVTIGSVGGSAFFTGACGTTAGLLQGAEVAERE